MASPEALAGKDLFLVVDGDAVAGQTEFSYEKSMDVQEIGPTHASELEVSYAPGKITRTITVGGVYSLTDPGVAAIDDAFEAKTPISVVGTFGTKTESGSAYVKQLTYNGKQSDPAATINVTLACFNMTRA